MLAVGLPAGNGRPRDGAGQDEAGPHLVQTPPAQDHEGPLPDQPEPGLQGAQDALAEDGARQESASGEIPFHCI